MEVEVVDWKIWMDVRFEDMDGLEVEDVDGVGGLLVFNSTW